MCLDYVNAKYLNWLLDPDVNKYLGVNDKISLNQLEEFVEPKINSDLFFLLLLMKKAIILGKLN